MLQSEDIDDNFFTPVAGSSLSNLFSKEPNSNEEQSTLKYVPLKSTSASKDAKKTQCMFSCAPYAFEWVNNTYVSKGKIGLAIIHILANGATNIILYDSNKSTLSCTSIESSLSVKWNNEKYISFYDNAKKYWGITDAHETLKTMIDILKSYCVIILPSNEEISLNQGDNTEQVNPATNTKTIKQCFGEVNPATNTKTIKQCFGEESDSDLSVNKKSKSLIYQRVTSMGQFMLPPQQFNKNTTDSSDEETYDYHKNPRHKFSKKTLKQNKSNDNEMNTTDKQRTNTSEMLSESKHDDTPLNETVKLKDPDESEQNIITNNGMHICLAKLSDKVDEILVKVTQNDKNARTMFSNEICQKLLNEYESKIKMYEEYILKQGISLADLPIKKMTSRTSEISEDKDIEIKTMKEEILSLRCLIERKDTEIANLENETVGNDKPNKKNLTNLSSNQCTSNNVEKTNVGQEADTKVIKRIMNDVYQTTVASFDNDQSYSGSDVKGVVAAVIKKITLQVLNETETLKNN